MEAIIQTYSHYKICTRYGTITCNTVYYIGRKMLRFKTSTRCKKQVRVEAALSLISTVA